jgi:hypothetical protein
MGGRRLPRRTARLMGPAHVPSTSAKITGLPHLEDVMLNPKSAARATA